MPGGYGIAEVVVRISGQPLQRPYAIKSVEIANAVHSIPMATLAIIAHGPPPYEQGAVLVGGPIKPAVTIEIGILHNNAEIRVFAGIVTAVNLRMNADAMQLEVLARDKAISLAGTRRSQIWANESDRDTIRAIVEAAGLKVGTSPAQDSRHEALVQHDCTDLDFILSRADARGWLVLVDDGTVSLCRMAIEGEATRRFAVGDGGIADAELGWDARTQATNLAGVVWSSENLAATQPVDGDVPSLPPAGISRGKLGGQLPSGPALLAHMVPLPAEEARSWSSARLARMRLSLFRGRITVAGMPDLKPMEVARLVGLGPDLSGDTLITGIRHRLDAKGFSTDIQFGLSPELVGRLPKLAGMPAGGLLPPIAGLQLGTIVGGEDGNAARTARVRVKVPALSADPPAVWARIATPDAGDNRGFCFFPEEGDEVLVGFLADDPRHPVVLGRLHGAEEHPARGACNYKE